MNITYNDITTRLYSVKNNRYYGDRIQPRLYTEQGKFCRENALNAINNWEHLAETTDEAFEKALDVFEEICLNENDSTVRHTASYLLEDIKKVRDASHLQNSIKYRNSRIKTKISTKINNRRDDVTNALTDVLQKIRHNLSANPNTPTAPNPPDRTANNDDAGGTPGVAEQCFDLFFAEATKCRECDRVIANYNRVSNRFNLDRIVLENNDTRQALWDIGACMDTYAIPFRKKYSCALENAYYLFAKHHIPVDNDIIIEGVTDYFIFTGSLKEEQIPEVTKVKENSVLFEFTDFHDLDFLYDDDTSIDQIEVPSEDASTLTENYGVDFGFLALNEEQTKKQQIKNNAKHFKIDLKKSTKKLVKDAKKGNPDERAEQEIKDQIDEFRKKAVKDKDNKNNLAVFKGIVNKLFTKNPQQIIYELQNLFSLIRVVFVVTATSLNPVLGLITFITDQIIKMTLERKQMDKIIDNYKKEIDVTNNKIEKTKDEQTKENLTKYRDALKKDLEKLNQHADTLYSDEENDERHANDWEDMDLGDDFDFEWDDAEFDELAKIVTVSDLVSSINEQLIEDKDLDGIVFGNVFKLDNDCLDSLTDFSCTVPAILSKYKLCNTLKQYRANLREGNCTVEDYIRIDCLNDNIYKLENSPMVYNTSDDLDAAMYYLSCLNEFVKMDCDPEYVTEAMGFTNTIKLALDRMKKGISKLSDKEKMASRTIDATAAQTSKAMERAMMNDSREAIIKGSVIPSASKCIKSALALGVAWAINPAIAVIAALGTFASHKKLEKKERQLVHDEIDIEIKMTERYLRQAEDNNDMEKVRQYEMALRSLQRQQQRIKYSMHVYHDNVPAPRGTES